MAVGAATRSINGAGYVPAPDGKVYGGAPTGNNAMTGTAIVTGIKNVGYTLSVLSSLDDADGIGTLHYQWQSNPSGVWTNIGTDSSTYVLTGSESGLSIRCIVSQTDSKGNSESYTTTAYGLILASSYLYKGIPNPVWGTIDPITVTAPSQPGAWPSAEVAGYYYIDNTNPAATDANTYGYPDVPRLTIPTTLSAGDYVEIAGGGTYDLGTQSQLIATGTEANPIWYRGSSSSNRPIIRCEHLIKAQYLFMENLHYDTEGKSLGIRTHSGSLSHHVCVRDCEISGDGTDIGNSSGIGIYGTSTEQFHNIVVYNNLIHTLGVADPAHAENDYHGVAPSSYCNDVWILGNTMYGLGGDGVQVGAATLASAARPYNIYVAGNVIHDCHENAVDVKDCHEVYISENIGYNFQSTSTSAGSAFVVHNNPVNVYFLFNTAHDCEIAYISTGATDAWFIGNIGYNINHTSVSWDPLDEYSYGVCIHFRSSTGGAINNSFYGYDSGIQIATGTGVRIQGNIFENRVEATGLDINIGVATSESAHSVDFNIFHPGSTERLQDNGTIYTLSSWNSTFSSSMGNASIGDPLYTDGANYDFSLQAGSVAIDAYEKDAQYAAYETLTGIAITKDFSGNDRPTLSTDYDIGAFEKVV